MRSSKQTLVGALAASAIALVSAYALAQAKPSAPTPAPTAAAACPCAKDGKCAPGCGSGPCAARAGVDCGPGQPCKQGEQSAMACPMGGLASVADIKVENTKTGATIQLVTRDAQQLSDVQARAAKLAELLRSGQCPMMNGERHAHGAHHGHTMSPAK